MLRLVLISILIFNYQVRANNFGFSFGSSCANVPVIQDFDISRVFLF